MTDVVIRAIAAGGDGVGTLDDGRTVFVPRTAPGDRVTVTNVRLHRRFARATIGQIVTEGPDRVTPWCPHYRDERCGSCQLMHLSIDAQRQVKGRIAGDALRRIARVDIADPVVDAAPDEWRYRHKIRLHHQNGRIGYHPFDAPARTFDVVDCKIADVRLVGMIAVLRAVRELLSESESAVTLRIDRDGGLHAVVHGGASVWGKGRALHDAARERDVTLTVWFVPEGGLPRVVAGDSDHWPATVFEQVHPVMGERVRRTAVELLDVQSGERIWDLYAGIGEGSVLLAARNADVVSVERDANAVRVAARLLPSTVDRRTGAVEDVAPTLPAPATVLTNPPRGGMDAAATAAIVRAAPRRVVYISCDPATLARDVVAMSPRYRVTQLLAFDQFPQTAHLECIAVLERA